MNKYIIVMTFCDKLDVANKIIDKLLTEKLVSGSQTTEIKSKYWWNNKIEEAIEYKLEFRTKENNFKKIAEKIKKIHDYEVCEISYYEIKGASNEFTNWIDINLKK